MKMGIMVAVILGLAGLSGWLYYENTQLNKQRDQEVAKARRDAERQLIAKVTTAVNQLAQANGEIARLNNEINFPIEIACKKGSSGKGYNIQVLNTFTNLLPVTVTFSNSTLKKSKTLTFDLNPGFSREVGRVEGWTAAAGDALQVECPGFLPVTRALE